MLCAKGVEQGSLKLMTEVLAETMPAGRARRAVRPELRRRGGARPAHRRHPGLPRRGAAARRWPRPSPRPTFRPYLATDMIGAEAGGAVKNVLAIACGIVEGRGLGRSAHAALITRGFAELTRAGRGAGRRGRDGGRASAAWATWC